MSREPVDLPLLDTALLHLIFSGALDTLTAGQVRVINDRLRRLDALDAPARAIVADCRVPRGDYLGDACRWCDNTIDRDGHRPGCPVGVLLPLLETTP